jgi:hypothetical protein
MFKLSWFSVIGENVLVKLSRELSSAMKKCSTSQCYLSLELRGKTEFCFVVIVDEIGSYILFKTRQNNITSALKIKSKFDAVWQLIYFRIFGWFGSTANVAYTSREFIIEFQSLYSILPN